MGRMTNSGSRILVVNYSHVVFLMLTVSLSTGMSI